MFLISLNLFGQFKIEVFSGMTVNPVEQPFLASVGFSPGIEIGKFSFEYALDLNINKRNQKAINAFVLNTSYQIVIDDNPLKFSLFYLHKPISQMLNIHNTGCFANYKFKKWEFLLGNNLNIYKFTNNAVDVYNILDNETLVEAFNLIYTLKYYLFKKGNAWNTYFNLSNFDKFVIEQEINPMINLGACYQKNLDTPSFYLDLWYQSAGFNNIRVNYFGFFYRIGVLWEID